MNTESIAPDAVLPEHEDDPHTLHIFMLVKATRAWLDMPTPHRLKFFEENIWPILRRRPQVRLRYFDSEAFNARASDVLLWETDDLIAWSWVCDHLRDTLFWDHYFEVLEILPSFEANYQRLSDPA